MLHYSNAASQVFPQKLTPPLPQCLLENCPAQTESYSLNDSPLGGGRVFARIFPAISAINADRKLHHQYFFTHLFFVRVTQLQRFSLKIERRNAELSATKRKEHSFDNRNYMHETVIEKESWTSGNTLFLRFFCGVHVGDSLGVLVASFTPNASPVLFLVQSVAKNSKRFDLHHPIFIFGRILATHYFQSNKSVLGICLQYLPSGMLQATAWPSTRSRASGTIGTTDLTPLLLRPRTAGSVSYHTLHPSLSFPRCHSMILVRFMLN